MPKRRSRSPDQRQTIKKNHPRSRISGLTICPVLVARSGLAGMDAEGGDKLCYVSSLADRFTCAGRSWLARPNLTAERHGGRTRAEGASEAPGSVPEAPGESGVRGLPDAPA